MSITTITEGKNHTIQVHGDFNFHHQKEFREAYESVDNSTRFIIDFAESSYIHSSALGMLLLLREYAGSEESQITLSNCNSGIQLILDTSNLKQLFTIHRI